MIDVYFDTETTGTNPKLHSIIQLSGIIEKDGVEVDRFDYRIKPHPKAKIEEEALAVNGHKLEELERYEPMSNVLKKFKRLLGKYIDNYDRTDKGHLIGFNNRGFDDFFLRMLFELCGDTYIGSWFWNDSLDVLVLASEYLKDRRHMMKSFKLMRVAKELGIAIDKDRLHDSLYDAEITREIYLIVTGRKPEPAKQFYYYYHPESDALWKTMDLDPDSMEYEIDFKDFRRILHKLKIEDGPHLIEDDLL